MRWYHVTLICWESNRQVFEDAFAAVEPDNTLSTNWNFLNTECVVKAPAGLDVSPVIAVYDAAPVSMTKSVLWAGN